ncbi:amidohydrolase family protein [Elioraea sp.]|uniref:amidohydrolase family protein n=1 Tax=Elioraea sp. TaxID=2185103 RepID=UPI003F6F4752
MMFDAHFHVFDPADPLVANHGFVPEHFTAAQYRARVAPLGVVGGAVVAASPQGPDPAPLLAAARTLGPRFVVVAAADPARDDAALAALAAAGVRGVRFNLYRNAAWTIGTMLEHARRAAAHGLHAEIYTDASTLAPHAAALARLRIVIDHLGMTAAGLPVTCDLARAGAKVKATGFGRVRLDPAAAMEAIASAAPHAMMAATDLPSMRADRPFADADIALIETVLGAALARAALHDTAAAFYRA